MCYYIKAMYRVVDIAGILALLCATAQQSYCHDAGGRRPSVRDIIFSDTAE